MAGVSVGDWIETLMNFGSSRQTSEPGSFDLDLDACRLAGYIKNRIQKGLTT